MESQGAGFIYLLMLQQSNFSEWEEKILKFWDKEKIFEKSLEKTKNGPRFIFYEGPPFANGLPGIHHLLSRAFKDIIIRYKTMRGFFVERKGGWDTHGLPTEISAEKKLAVKTKKDIEEIGIEKFIQVCKESIFTYKKEWEEFTRRIGYWLDLKNAYITCQNDYIESLWWILKQIWEKGLLYEDYKVVPYCPRCGTSLSSHELAQGYKKIKEKSIFFKLKVKNEKHALESHQGVKTTNKNLKFENAYFLVWTTTPWTLPGNVALAVGENIDYTVAEFLDLKHNEKFKLIFSNTLLERMEEVFKAVLVEDINNNKRVNEAKNRGFDYVYEVLEEFKGKDLIGLEYEPLFDFVKPDKPAYKIIAGDFVNTEEGTGIVHIAPAFGEDDLVAFRQQIPNSKFQIPKPVDKEGKMITPGYKWNKMFVKNADPLIIKDLEKRNLLFSTEMYEHDYPFCWRCNTPLLYYAKNSWFIKMTAIKEELIKNNEKINWIPGHIKYGRFGEWLNEVKDWNLSRERYWGVPLPIWKCQKCNKQICIGSVKELKKLQVSSYKLEDLHRPHIDKITFRCDKCGGGMKRVAEVIDCWFDSGAMPFAQAHWPFAQNQESNIKNQRYNPPRLFPADFICEGMDQTRGWFYTLLAISTLLELGPSYKNVISHGLVLDVKGQKMSKSKGNVVKPQEVIDKFGADCARFYFYTINQVGESKKFSFKEIQDLHRKFFFTLMNSYSFFETYVSKKEFSIFLNSAHRETSRGDAFQFPISSNILDRWIVSRLNNLNVRVVNYLDNYDIVSAARLFENFIIDDLSNWYIRRSRRKFQKPKNKKEKQEVSQTLYYVFFNLVKLLAPFVPFISEEIFQKMQDKNSVHLCDYPTANKKLIDRNLEEKMEQVRKIVAVALAQRVEAGIKVRQPLKKLKVKSEKLKVEKELLDLIKDEVNVKEIVFDAEIKKLIELDTKITPKLKEEGISREAIRLIQSARKKAKFAPRDLILIEIILFEKNPLIEKIFEKRKKYIEKETNSCQIEILLEKEEGEFDFEKEIVFENKKLCLRLKRK